MVVDILFKVELGVMILEYVRPSNCAGYKAIDKDDGYGDSSFGFRLAMV